MTGVDTAITRRSFRQVSMGAAICAVVFGGTVAASAVSYVSSFPTEASRKAIAATTGTDRGLAILLGPVSSIDTVGGYTVYKCYAFLTAIGGVWALLMATRLLRGEEDSGRWALVLAGSTRASRATAAALTGLALAVGVVFAGTAAFTLLAARNGDVGFGFGESVVYGLSITIAPAVFGAVGAVTSQLARTRRLASGLGITVLAVLFVVRMIGDSGPHARWLLWTTPFGWTELVRPFTANDLWPFVPAVITIAVLTGTAIVLASRRDVGDGVLASRDVVAPRRFGLGSPFGLVARLELPGIVGWAMGIAATGFAFGIVAKVATGSIPSSLADTLEKFGVRGTFVRQYFGVVFLMVAAVVALIPAGQLGAAADEETSGRLVHVLVRPPRRPTVIAGRLGLAAATVVGAGLLAAVAGWVGAVSQGADIGFARMVGAGLNIVPTALLVLGIGAAVLAVAPRFAASAVYAVVTWSLVADLLASLVTSMRWIDQTSLFHSMALAPAQPIDVTSIVVTSLIAVLLCVAATALFARRGLQPA